MNTPRTPKRHKPDAPYGGAPIAEYGAGLNDKVIGAKFAKVVTTFEQLENAMALVLAVLLGGHDTETAGYVLRALRAPQIKKDLMWRLLEKAPVNAALPEDYDNILLEYARLANERNQLVHGKWQTLDEHPRRVFVARSSEHGRDWFEAVEITADELELTYTEITSLYIKVVDTALPVLLQRRQDAGVPPSGLVTLEAWRGRREPEPEGT